MSQQVERLELSPSDRQAINQLVASLIKCLELETAEEEPFLRGARVLAHDLPVSVREFLHRFRSEEFPCCLLSGHTVDDQGIGPTPTHWRARQSPSPALAAEVLLVLYGSLLGDVFGWATQQDGFLVHDVLPIRGYEHEQLGFSSEAALTWHTEDAFHPLRGDYLGLFCLRNPYGAATTVGRIDDVNLNPADRQVLSQPRFIIRPDNSHQPDHNTTASPGRFEDILRMNERPELVPALFGDPEVPYVRIDPDFMEAQPGDQAAASALKRLEQAIEAQLLDVVLRPGDVIFLDNYRVVHGRNPFRARFDGTDRWLKRINVTRDLRKSWAANVSAPARVIA